MDTSHHNPHKHHHHRFHQHHHSIHQNQQPLIKAVKDNNLRQVEELLKTGVSADTRDLDGHTSLYWACCRGHDDVCYRLLRSGCDVTAKGKAGTTALMACSDNGNEMCLQLLLKHPLTTLDDISDRGDTALHMAAYRGLRTIAALLCQAGANLRLRNVNGQTPLDVAFVENHKECFNFLKDFDQNNQISIPGPHASPPQRTSSPSTSISTPYPQHDERSNLGSPHLFKMKIFENKNTTVSRNADDEHLLSSDSALGLSVHSSIDSSQFVSPDGTEPTSLPSDVAYPPRIQTRPGNRDSNEFHTSVSNVFISNLHSPVEMDERPFFKMDYLNPHAWSSHQSQPQSNQHIVSSHHNLIGSPTKSNTSTSQKLKPLSQFESIGYHSSVVDREKYPVDRTNHFDSFSTPCPISSSPSIDTVSYPPSFTHPTSVEDISGPPAISYSPALEHDHVKTIYSNAIPNTSTPVVLSSSSTKCKYPINDLSSRHKSFEVNGGDTAQYNIVVDKSETFQKYSPNIHSAETSFKIQNTKQELAFEKTEILPGLNISSFLTNLQMKVLTLEESLDTEKSLNTKLQSDNKNLREENEDLKNIIEELTHKLSKLS